MKTSIATFVSSALSLVAVFGSVANPPAVELVETAQTVTLANREVRLIFDRQSSTLISLVRDGRELLAKGGGYVQTAGVNRQDSYPTRWKYQVVRCAPELVEIAFVNTHPDCPFDFSAHYILRADDPGFYNYLTWGHDAKRSRGTLRLAQYNFALRIDPELFTTAAVDDQRIVRFPKGDVLTKDREIMDATYHLPDGSYYSKYFFAAERDEQHPVYGAMSDLGMGIWMILPSNEHLNGGPEHQELTVHQAGESQVLLAHAQAAHYGAGILVSDSKDGSWRKVSAPWFVYVNSASSEALLWQDARRRAAAEVAAWPYRWLDETDFQLGRGRLTGRLAFAGSRPVAGARIVLASHETKPAPLQWQQQWRGYRFHGWTDADGRFDLGKLRPGLYDLYAWQPGTFGGFERRSVLINEGENLDLGELAWSRSPPGEVIWQIGSPDRSAQEFGFAENFRQWGLWRQIAEATAGAVRFVVGQSAERDWPFQMAVTQNPDRSWQVPAWSIEFNNPVARRGRAVLKLGIASYEGKQATVLTVLLNEKQIGSVGRLEISGAAQRSGVHAGYQEREITFPARKLITGTNTLVLRMTSPGNRADNVRITPAVALLWDALRLETIE
jgi:rhamnogalacturonan endolyase